MNKVVTIADVAIRQDDQGRYSLNDLHRASGGEKRHSPNYWLNSQQTKELIATIALEEGDTGFPVSVVRGGPAQGSYVAKELVYAYAMWISPAFHLKVIRVYDQLQAQPQAAALSRLEILQIAMESEQARIQAESERDEAVRTKAQIGSKREATAMATASAATRVAERLSYELGRNSRHATVIAVQNALGTVYPRNAYVGLRKWCKQHGTAPVEVVDERYGMVKAWPAGAWLDVYDVDLGELFGNDMLPLAIDARRRAERRA